jgi:hypothetical protein
MKNKVIISKDEWADNLGEYMKKFRHENPYYPIDPFQRICEKRLEFITDDNKKHQRMLSKEAIANFGEPPF